MQIKHLLIGAALMLGAASSQAGAPPTVMFLPDKQFCNENGFVTKSERNGKIRTSENYDEAFLNGDLKNVITQLEALLGDAGLKPKTYTEASEIDDEEEAELELFESEDSGEELKLTPYEAALQKLRPDIIIKVGYNVHPAGFNYTCDYRLQAIDSYSGKSVATITANTPSVKSVMPLSMCIKNAATEHMSNFISKLQEHFDDIQTNGREVTLFVGVTGASGSTMESTFGGKELSQVIHEWLHDNTVNHAFSERGVTRNRASYEQIRIPLKDSNGAVYQARQFAAKLKKHLADVTGLEAENATKGLGAARLMIGK